MIDSEHQDITHLEKNKALPAEKEFGIISLGRNLDSTTK